MDKIFNSLVRIQSQGYQYNWLEPFKPLDEADGVGTGFFVNDKGYILTCAHVISDAVKIWVSIPSNGLDKYDSEIVSFYPEQDIAIIKILNYKKKINYLQLGNSDKINPGEDVMAIGYPLGQDKLKITKGTISGREMSLIQTDTPLNPGNSGGPLLNNNHEVLGINSSAYKSEDAENVGFAIPINIYKSISEIMLNNEEKLVFQPSIGCVFYNSNEDIINFYGCDGECKSGVVIKSIMNNSELKNKEIENGDILCNIGGYDVDNFSECRVEWNIEKVPLSSIVERYKVGEKIKMSFWSNKKKKMITINTELKSSDTIYPIRLKYPPFENIEWEIFGGIVMVELTLNHIENIPFLMEYIKPEKRNHNKVIITQIYPGSSLSKFSILSPGSIIKKINNKEINTIKDIRNAISNPIKKNSQKYLKIETEDNKIAVLDMDKIIKENLFLSQNYNFPITEINQKIIEKEYLSEMKKSKKKSKKSNKLKSKKNSQIEIKK
jgi:serine protease Do